MTDAQSISLAAPLRRWPSARHAGGRQRAVALLASSLGFAALILVVLAANAAFGQGRGPTAISGWPAALGLVGAAFVVSEVSRYVRRSAAERHRTLPLWNWSQMSGHGSLAYLNFPGEAVFHLQGHSPLGTDEVLGALTTLPGVRWSRHPEGMELRLETTRSSAIAFVSATDIAHGSQIFAVIGVAPAKVGAGPVTEDHAEIDAVRRPLGQLERAVVEALSLVH